MARPGPQKLTIDRLVKGLGVTKGSFYWHFRNRRDFQTQLLQHWDRHGTQCVVEMLETADDDPAERPGAIIETVVEQNLACYDISIWAWAAQDPDKPNASGLTACASFIQ